MEEIERSWSLCDVADANESIDVREDVTEWNRLRIAAEREAMKRAGKLPGM